MGQSLQSSSRVGQVPKPVLDNLSLAEEPNFQNECLEQQAISFCQMQLGANEPDSAIGSEAESVSIAAGFFFLGRAGTAEKSGRAGVEGLAAVEDAGPGNPGVSRVTACITSTASPARLTEVSWDDRSRRLWAMPSFPSDS